MAYKSRLKWLKGFKEKHGDKYLYSLIPDQVHCDTKVFIICPDHGIFIQSLTHHLRGHGCTECGRDKQRKTPEEKKRIKKPRDTRYKKSGRRGEVDTKYWKSGRGGEVSRERYQRLKDKMRPAIVKKNTARYHRLKHTPKAKAALTCRTLVQRVTLAARGMKTANTQELLGYSFEDFRQHIEKLFESWMNWANHGEWHVDHIKPVSAFISEGITCPATINSLQNLRPLRAVDNLRKGAKYLK